MKLFKMSTDSDSIVAAYKVANAISLTAALGFGIASMRHLALSRAGLLVATFLTFFNFATLYWLPFDPVLTDGMALAIGSIQLWAYLSRRYVVLAIASAVGGFIWPSTAEVGAALLFFPRPPKEEPERSLLPSIGPSDRPSMLDLAIAALLAAVMTWFASTLADYVPPYRQHTAIKTLFRLSCAIFSVTSFIALKELIRVGPSLRQLARIDLDALTGKALAVAMLVGVSRTVKWIAIAPSTRVPQAPDFQMWDVLKSGFFYPVQRPAVWLASHLGFFGPAIVLVLFCWRDLCNHARRIGFGLNAVLGIAFLMLLNSQSRVGMDFMPIVLPLAAVAAARFPWTLRRLWELGALTFLCSKLWYSIVQKPVFDGASLMNNVGPWMENEAWAAHLVVLILASIWVLWMRRQTPASADVIWLTEEQPS
jgi:hypothetical protein